MLNPTNEERRGWETYVLLSMCCYEPIGFDSLVSRALFHVGHRADNDVGVGSLVGFVFSTKGRALSEASQSGFLRNNPDNRNELYLLHHPAEWFTLTWWGGLLHQ
jgi:hypothetical protein